LVHTGSKRVKSAHRQEQERVRIERSTAKQTEKRWDRPWFAPLPASDFAFSDDDNDIKKGQARIYRLDRIESLVGV
jgi:hypothetical protein